MTGELLHGSTYLCEKSGGKAGKDGGGAHGSVRLPEGRDADD